MELNKIDFHEFIESLTEILDIKDTYTKGHSGRVADFATQIAKKFDFSPEQHEEIHIAGHLHDLGKVGISDSILQKKGKLNIEEYKKIQEHSILGYNILVKVSHLKKLAKYVKHHHERWDGNGYPDKLKGEEIPIQSRILSVADAYDAMTSRRSYRNNLSKEYAVNELIENKWTQFDGNVVDAFVELLNSN